MSAIIKITTTATSALPSKPVPNTVSIPQTLPSTTYTLPSDIYGLYVQAPTEADYLIESNPMYTDLNNYVGSEYFLRKMQYTPDRSMQKKGTGYFICSIIAYKITME